ncbi:hypothetical protein Pyn_07296 [Prunus yedoensis var. nudiflora]|uniref:Uncharacterized protein n=1 Tax=Prunus yedoensis var. nudiflora TaxID=2094558 RepID=A0A314XNA3_PRUYE|nr:hypothetical protein Pyn_07296 [Prunus yedoensis var. nudiflora]
MGFAFCKNSSNSIEMVVTTRKNQQAIVLSSAEIKANGSDIIVHGKKSVIWNSGEKKANSMT